MTEPATINPTALYDDATLRRTLGLTETALATARRGGTLRFTRHGQRVLYLGAWVIDWLEATSVSPTSPVAHFSSFFDAVSRNDSAGVVTAREALARLGWSVDYRETRPVPHRVGCGPD